MKTSEKGIELIKKFEGVRLTAYQCAAGKWTIGYGHTGYVKFFKKKVCAGMTITQEQAVELLKDDLSKFETVVYKHDSKYRWNQNEFDALVSFAFNIGSIDDLTANGTRSKSEIADKMLLYNKVGKKVLNGLTDRRKAEQALFLTNNASSTECKNLNTGTYQITENLNVRTGPGTNYEIKPYDQLTSDGKAHATSAGTLKDGTRVIVKEIIRNGDEIWGKIPSGYIALHYNNENYVSKC